MQWIKDLWSKWKVHITVVGGAVVVATAYATCTVQPAESVEVTPAEEAPAVEAETEPTSGTTNSASGTDNSNSETNPTTEND